MCIQVSFWIGIPRLNYNFIFVTVVRNEMEDGEVERMQQFKRPSLLRKEKLKCFRTVSNLSYLRDSKQGLIESK